MSDVILEMVEINKNFPGVKALDNVSFSLKKGSVHALMGENGAGKSTLMKCLYGMYQPDSGEVFIDGEAVAINNAAEAIQLGITMIHQELQVVPKMTIAENIFLGRYPMNGPFIDHKTMNYEAQKYVDSVNLHLPVDTLMEDLTISQQQSVEIAKAISQDARIIIMDEPTSSITENEVASLFDIIRKLCEQGISIIYISHKMDEIKEIADELTVLRDGEYVGTYDAKEISNHEIIQHMVGRDIIDRTPTYKNNSTDDIILEVKNYSSPDELSFKDCSFQLKKGEILGVGGLMGSQRSELLEAIYGLRSRQPGGEISINGKAVEINHPQDAITHGLALVTEDRKKSGIFGVLSVEDNISVASLSSYSGKAKFLQHNKIAEVVQHNVDALNIKTPRLDTKVENLSGGNQQKVILARWLESNPDILILDEPTRGIDIGAKNEIYNIITNLSEQGKSIILITSEMPELLGLSDRIMVMCEGRISGFLEGQAASQEDVMALATAFSQESESMKESLEEKELSHVK